MERSDYISLSALQSRIRGCIDDSFGERIWLKGEISEIKHNPAGHCYMTLVEKEGISDRLKAKAQAIVWASSYRLIGAMFEHQTGRPLSVGMNILVKVQVQYSELYGLSLIVYDLDPSFSLGQMELLRQKTILRLQQEGMMEMNSLLELPLLPRRVAVVSSLTAAGYRDFMKHIQSNDFGIVLSTTLFQAPMQGADAPAGIVAALDAISGRASEFDLVVIVRGGGAAMDLVCYDDYELCVNVAQFPLPVLTGIGHDHDYHIVDMVAHTHVKTPTALADYMIDLFSEELQQIDSLQSRLRLALRSKNAARTAALERMVLRLRNGVGMRFADARATLDRMELRVEAVNPQKILSRGYSMALRDGRNASSATLFSSGGKMVTMFADGVVESVVTSVRISDV